MFYSKGRANECKTATYQVSGFAKRNEINQMANQIFDGSDEVVEEKPKPIPLIIVDDQEFKKPESVCFHLIVNLYIDHNFDQGSVK